MLPCTIFGRCSHIAPLASAVGRNPVLLGAQPATSMSNPATVLNTSAGQRPGGSWRWLSRTSNGQHQESEQRATRPAEHGSSAYRDLRAVPVSSSPVQPAGRAEYP